MPIETAFGLREGLSIRVVGPPQANVRNQTRAKKENARNKTNKVSDTTVFQALAFAQNKPMPASFRRQGSGPKGVGKRVGAKPCAMRRRHEGGGPAARAKKTELVCWWSFCCRRKTFVTLRTLRNRFYVVATMSAAPHL
jgi:hypothetical protein